MKTNTFNIKDLARELNVSVSTVSRALRDGYDISTETKQKVLALAQERNYRPNPYASSLRKQKSRTIAVIVPELASNFFSQVLNGIQAVAQEKGYHVLIYQTHDDAVQEASILHHLQCGRADGFLMSIASKTQDISHLEDLQKSGFPIVFFDRVCENIATAKVTTDDYDSAFKATEHLIEQGCTRIAFLMISKNLSIGINRMRGYQDALLQHGIEPDEQLIVDGCIDKEESSRKVEKLLRSRNRPDAVFASIERLTLTCYDLCRKLNIRIPADMKVVGFSNLETAPLLSPSLTTIVQPSFAMGEKAATILFQALKRKDAHIANEKIVLRSQLVVRDSSLAPADHRAIH